jgi:[calcium/calmodulin-dependent protein kinase] kinase
MKAVSKFKGLLSHKRPEYLDGDYGGNMLSEPPEEIDSPLLRTHSDTLANRKAVEGHLVFEGISRDIQVNENLGVIHESQAKGDDPSITPHSKALPPGSKIPTAPLTSHSSNEGFESPQIDAGRGHAHDPLEDTLFLNIGPSHDTPGVDPGSTPIVSESPGAVDINVYEKAYEEEIQKILQARPTQHHRPTLFLTKRVEQVAHLRDHKDITDFSRASPSKEHHLLPLTSIAELAKSKIMAERKEESAK